MSGEPRAEEVEDVLHGRGAGVVEVGAAVLAGVEAWRLADLTQDAITDARNAAIDTHADTIRAENLTADALGQAEANANRSHEDSVSANKISILLEITLFSLFHQVTTGLKRLYQ